MSSRWALLAGAAVGICVAFPSAAHAQGRGPFADVPQSHWAYDAVNQLAQRGIFTGYPDGTFAGRRALTRYEFAVALQRMLQDVQRRIDAIHGGAGTPGAPGEVGPAGPVGPPGPPGPPGVTPQELEALRHGQELLRSDVTNLQRLAQEFSSELAMLGSDVDQIKRNLAALTDRVSRLEYRVAHMPVITGNVNIGFRADSTNVDRPATLTGPTVPIFGLVDRDGRLLNSNRSLLNRVNAFYDIDLGVTANISDVATARLLLNAGNYLTGYLGNRISQVDPFIDGGVGGKSTTGFPNFTTESVIPYYLYIETPLKIAGTGTQLTVGKFGHQFTPYTLKMVDVDSYFYNDKTDLGDYPITGGRINFRAAGINFSAYAGVHQNDYAQLSSTAGFVTQGLYLAGAVPPGGVPVGLGGAGVLPAGFSSLDLSKFQPQGSFGAFGLGSPPGGFGPVAPFVPLGIGSTNLEQSAGVRATYVAKKFQIGGTYLTAGASDGTAADPAFTDTRGNVGVGNLFRQLSVYGFDVNVQPIKHLALSADVTESKWDSRFGGEAQGRLFGMSENDRRAYDLRAKFPLWRAQLSLYYKKIGEGFDAPGSWGRLGNYINPRAIEGIGGTLDIPVWQRLTFEAEGADYNYSGDHRLGANSSDLVYLRGGFRYPLTSRNSVDLGYERVDYQPNGPEGTALHRLEQYYNVGFSHQFNSGLSWRILYQFLDSGDHGIFDVPGFHYQAQIIATQFQVRF